MGNRASCIALIPGSGGAGPAEAVVVDPEEGSVTVVEQPGSAAELMLESPGHVVARAEETISTRRVAGLPAEERILAGVVYLLVPTRKVGARLPDRQLEVIVRVLADVKRRRRGKIGSRSESDRCVAPVSGEKEKALTVSEFKVGPWAEPIETACRRMGQWRPALEPIRESC